MDKEWATGVAVLIGVILWLLAIAVSLAPVASSVGMAQPSGYTDGWVTREVNRLAGRSITTTCYSNDQEWAQTLMDAGLPPAQYPQVYYGFSRINAGQVYLSPYVCVGLRKGLVGSTRRAYSRQVAWAVDVMLHESAHVGRFTRSESEAEACAAKELPGELNRLYHVKYRTSEMHSLTAQALLMRRTQVTAYTGGSCS